MGLSLDSHVMSAPGGDALLLSGAFFSMITEEGRHKSLDTHRIQEDKTLAALWSSNTQLYVQLQVK